MNGKIGRFSGLEARSSGIEWTELASDGDDEGRTVKTKYPLPRQYKMEVMILVYLNIPNCWERGYLDEVYVPLVNTRRRLQSRR